MEKYRFWQGKKMIYSGSIGEREFQEWHDLFSYGHINDGSKLCPLMRCTGMQDENGEDIYFDDIVDFISYDGNGKIEYEGSALVVETMNGGAGLRYEWSEFSQNLFPILDGGSGEDFWIADNAWSIQVIGNRWECPSMLMDNGAGLPTFKE